MQISSNQQGIKELECYCLLKFGNAKDFGLGGKKEYLLELPMYPENVTEGLEARWSSQSILGRSADISAFAGTSLKSTNFSLTLHRDMLTYGYWDDSGAGDTNWSAFGSNQNYAVMNQSNPGEQRDTSSGYNGTRSWYVAANRIFQAACYAQYTDAGRIPPIMYFVFGQMILKGYVRSYSTTWKKPIINTFYGWNEVQISMECFPDNVISAHEIIIGSASTQNTFNTLFPTENARKSTTYTRNFDRPNLRSWNERGTSLGGSTMDT